MRIGIDAQSIAEVLEALVRHGDRYRRRIFTADEVEVSGGWAAEPDRSARRLASRFAAKEAALKALQPTDRVPRWTEIEIVGGNQSQPALRLTGVARVLAEDAGLTGFELSLSRTADLALAVVVAT